MKQWMTIEVRGKTKQWSWHLKADPQYLAEWQADGVQIFALENTIPEWVVDAGLLRPWVWAQDFWNKCMRLW